MENKCIMCRLPIQAQKIEITVSQDDSGELRKKQEGTEEWDRKEKTSCKICGDCASKHFDRELIGFLNGRISVK